MSRLKKLIFGETPYVKVEDKNRFYYCPALGRN